MAPELDRPPTHDVDVAPWLEPPSPPPKDDRTFHFPPKGSFSSLWPGSSSGLFSRLPRGSDSHSNLSIADLAIAPTSTSMRESRDRSFSSTPELRKTKSSMLSSLRKKVSKKSLPTSSNAGDESEQFLLRPPPLNSLNSGSGNFSQSEDVKPPDPGQQEIKLDTNFEEMEGIIDLAHLNERNGAGTTSSDSDSASSRSLSLRHQFGGLVFNSPWPGDAIYQPRKPSRKVSSNAVLPLPDPPVAPLVPVEGWTAPESWSVAVKDGTDPLGEAEESSSDESGGENGAGGLTAGAGADYGVNGAAGHAKRAAGAKRTAGAVRAGAGAQHKIQIRIYKADNTYHVVSMSTNVTVAALSPKLDQRLPAGEEREMHQLYLKERGRERILAQTERPADIVRRCLEQAGYDDTDGQRLLGSTEFKLSFLLEFVYKSVFLGPAEELRFDNFEYMDLTGRSLRTIPVVLHQHADCIVSLRLSRNPMIEIPLDFIQSCTTLRELCLSDMAVKKVPHNLRHSATLTHLDLSCNRIDTLDGAYLDDIPGLTTLHVQNNRLKKLPWSFPRLRRLIKLNISNNKFRMFPDGVSELVNLRDLDISFNMISELPEEIGKLKNLERLLIVGNQVSKLPDEFGNLGRLAELDCRRNQISDLTVACMLPKIEMLSADHNGLQDLALSMGPCLTTLDVSCNEIRQFTLVQPVVRGPFALTSLDISNAKLTFLNDYTVSQLTSLRRLKLDNNSFRSIPESLGDLKWLETLSCADNTLEKLPQSVGKLQRLETLDAHNNSLTELPISLWNCASLSRLNVTSNLLVRWHDPLSSVSEDDVSSSSDNMVVPSTPTLLNRKPSTSAISDIPPLAHSLELLYLGKNSFTDEVLHPLMLLKELRVLNLSFNNIQDIPSNFFCHLTKLEEVYLSGNGLTSFPSEDLPKLTRLATLFLNGNKLQTLPQEIGKMKSLTMLDVGSNCLKYNINNWEFDWNWNFNKNLRYLNLSGNNRLQIKSDVSMSGVRQSWEGMSESTFSRGSFAGFSELTQLRVLGLMDVTITTTRTGDIPDENDNRRVRTSFSVVNGMSYGIADTLGKNEHLSMFDLVHKFLGMKKDAVFAMFGGAQPPKQLPPATTTSNRLAAKYLQENFVPVFISQTNSLDPERNEGIPDALRRSFLKLNLDLRDSLFSSTRRMSQTSTGTNLVTTDPSIARSGVSGIVLYILDKKMYVANVGNALAVVSKDGRAVPLSRKHDPYDCAETARIRAAGGWISAPGLVSDEIDISRLFGFYHLMPIVNARPDIVTYDLTGLDEFVIIANRGLWDYVSYQTAVDIARRTDPMVAAQKLRDFAIGYGFDGSAMIMVISVADLFKDASTVLAPDKRKKRGIESIDRSLNRLKEEVPPPVGHIAIVFTAITSSARLWDTNTAMPTAMRLHNSLLRRFLRLCGGYEVKTEADSFMCSFPTVLAAVWWCMTVQIELMTIPWPLEILESADEKAAYDGEGRIIARGLSVRMGIHYGVPLCETDPITNRMDYFGPIVNRSSRIGRIADGGHIMCSSDVIRKIDTKIFETESKTEYSDQSQDAIDAVRRLDPVVVPVGEVKLEGLEVSEILWLIFPSKLIGRKGLDNAVVDPTRTSDSLSVAQMRELAVLCRRLEMRTAGRGVPLRERRGSLEMEYPPDEPMFLPGEPSVLLPPTAHKMTNADLVRILYLLTIRIENTEKLMTGLDYDSINPIDAFLQNQQRRSALLAQDLTSADLCDALRSCDQLISASLLTILDSRDSRAAVLLLEADRGQSFMDAVQDVIDRGSLSNSHTSKARRLVVRLSATSDRLPSSLFITGVTGHDEQPTFRGGFGDVYRASYRDKTVALKRIRIFQLNTQSELKRIRLQFCREALVWQTLEHKYILPLVGIDRETFPLSFCMVSPWMMHGTVLKYLSQHRGANVDKLLLQVAEGLGYLHSMNIVHGDLRGTNILVSDHLNACLADFGLTSVIAASSTSDTSSTNHAGSTRWLAPELMQPRAFGGDRCVRTPASDVYAFACVCLELHTGRPPFSDLTLDAPVIFKVIAGERPPRPDTVMSDDLWELVTAAWAQNSCDRPKIEEIIGRIRTNASVGVLSTDG